MPRKPAQPHEKKVIVSTRVTPTILSKLEAMADADERTLSFIVERVLREYFDRKPRSDRKR